MKVCRYRCSCWRLLVATAGSVSEFWSDRSPEGPGRSGIGTFAFPQEWRRAHPIRAPRAIVQCSPTLERPSKNAQQAWHTYTVLRQGGRQQWLFVLFFGARR